MTTPGVLVLVRMTVPREVEEEVRFVSDLLLGETRSLKRGEGGNELRETSSSQVDLRRGAEGPKACEAPLVANQAGKWGEACLPIET